MPDVRGVGATGTEQPGHLGAVAAIRDRRVDGWPGRRLVDVTTHFSFAAPVRSPVLISSVAYPCAV
jgi:hypothetical protein